jgi:hypothetical protein
MINPQVNFTRWCANWSKRSNNWGGYGGQRIDDWRWSRCYKGLPANSIVLNAPGDVKKRRNEDYYFY